MSSNQPRALAAMQSIADALVEELRPHCERIEIAGSVRRRKPECADIELVCAPRFGAMNPPGELLPRDVNLLDDYCRVLREGGRLVDRLSKVDTVAYGERYKRVRVDETPVDLFSVIAPASWGVVFLIRTGPSDFSRRMVTRRSASGWRQDGCLPEDCRVRDGALWRGETRLEMPEEECWFALAGIPYIKPEARR